MNPVFYHYQLRKALREERHPSQQKYSTIKKEILSIVLCVQKFQNDIFNKRFLICIDCKATPSVLTKDVQNLVSKHIFVRWQALLDSTGSQARSNNTVKVSSQYGHEVVSQRSGTSSQYNYNSDTAIRLRPPNTLANIVKNSTTKEHIIATPVSSLNPLVKISNSKLVSCQNPYEDQYLEMDELLPVIVLEKDQAKVNPIQIVKTLFPPDFHYLPIHPHKTKTFYEFILVDTYSIEIFHTQDKQGNI
ncbi:hypothetical protein CR513_08510, partial [Mucuna pruriens]